MQLSELITSIQGGDEKIVEWLYQSYREEFVQWAVKTFSVDEEIALDAFQEGVVNLYFNAKQDKITTKGAGIKTYLFAIGKNTLFNKLRKQKVEVSELDSITQEEPAIDVFDVSEQQEQLSAVIKHLGENCQELLRLFYYENNSMEAIATKMKYKNENVAKTQKMRCLKELRKLFKART